MLQPDLNHGDYSLNRTQLFSGLTPRALHEVESHCEWRYYSAREAILAPEDQLDKVYFIAEGHARAIVQSPGGKIVSFHELTAGDTFGEIAAIDSAPRSATVEALTTCLVAAMPAPEFRELLETQPDVARAAIRQLASTVRRLSTRVSEFGAAVMAITSRRDYAEMQGSRSRVAYPDDEAKSEILEKTFRRSAEDPTPKLSNDFYALMLKRVGERIGWEAADGISKSVFHEIGRLQTREALALGVDIPRDSRAPAIVFIMAVHSASPEYDCEILEYAPKASTVRAFGVSRYDRMANLLGIEEHLSFPEFASFFEGVGEELGIPFQVSAELQELGAVGRYECIYRCTLVSQRCASRD